MGIEVEMPDNRARAGLSFNINSAARPLGESYSA